MDTILSARNIVKAFGEGQEKRNVLDGVSIDIGEGEFVAVMGPSGSGKSTLMYALSGMDTIDGGSVAFRGRDLSGLGESGLADTRRKAMGFVFQQPTLLKILSVRDNIVLPAMRDNRKNAAAIGAKADALMKRTGIADLAGRDIAKVSGGQLQRAGICRALMNDPDIIFGDEPTGALNSAAAAGIMDIFEEINADGTAVVLVTHDPTVAARTNRVMFMRDGKIVSELVIPKDGADMPRRVEAVAARMRELGV